MADIPSTDILHDMKKSEKQNPDNDTAHHEGSSSVDSNEKSQKDVERTASHGAGYELSHLPIDEHGEYVVTMKTWAVVVVSSIQVSELTRVWIITLALGARCFIRRIILASSLLQYDSGGNGGVVRIVCR